MTLTPEQLRLAIFCAEQERLARHRGKPPGPQSWNDKLIQALATELAVASRPRQSEVVGLPCWNHDDDLSARQVAEMMSWTVRRVQRHADKLGARRVDGRLIFRASTIREHIEGQAA